MLAVQGPDVEDVGRHLMGVVEYDGTNYHGFQIQANAPTVQAALEEALANVVQQPVSIRYAGRTDTGVHAIGQVVDFWTTWARSLEELHRAWNAVLPADVVVRELRQAAQEFHSRYSARSRVYRYRILNQPIRSPLRRQTHTHVAPLLDVAKMHKAAQVLVGEHDFRTFGAPTQPGGPTVRVVKRIDVWRDGDEVVVELEANAYLQRMVRRIVAALVNVGQGQLTVQALGDALAAADPATVDGVAPAHGLYLAKVKY